MPPGLRFINVDLHVHTPASKCFIEADVTPDLIVEQSLAAGMQAIGVTDHNTAEWVDCVKAAAVDRDLVVFPGVEITVQPGVHVLAIFPEDCEGAHVTDLLSELGLRKDDRGNPDALVTDFGIHKVVSKIREHQALPILAHIDDVKGAWKVLEGQTLLKLWQEADYAAVEIVGESLPEAVGKDPYRRVPAYYWASDNPHPHDPVSHSHYGIGARYSRFKLGEVATWEGLRLCFLDPSTRICPAGAQTSTHPIIESVQVEGGFLNELDISLNPNLNCFIGGRGTGKSCLLELIRYAFNILPKTDTNRRQANSILENTLRPGSRIQIRINLGDGAAYRIKRTAEQEPRVFRDDGSELLAVKPSDLLPLEIYGQKEIYEISQDPAFQLRLLDNYLAEALSPLQQQEDDLVRRLRDNAATIFSLNEEISAAEEKLAKFGSIEEEIRRMEQLDFVTRLDQKQKHDREKHWLDQAKNQVDELHSALKEFAQNTHIKPELLETEQLEDLPNQPMLKELQSRLREIQVDLAQTLNTLQEKILTIWQGGENQLSKWQVQYDAHEEAYQALLREFQDADRALSPDRYVQLQRERQQLTDLRGDTEKKKQEVSKLYQTRQALLVELRNVRLVQYETRRDKAAEVTRKLQNVVRITIIPQGNRVDFSKQLEAIFQGLRIQHTTRDQIAATEAPEPVREAQRPIKIGTETHYLVSRIPHFLDPIDLANAIRYEKEAIEDQESLLKQQYKVESDSMRRNLAGLSEEKLFEMEIVQVPDLPIFELKVGKGELGYRPLSALSVGQKCTALLSLVLLESPYPLLIDQPEDNLDNHFIFDQIVATLRSAKERRQFLIATHNANIPVSGDAELIVVLQADEKHGWVDPGGFGSIDTPSIKEAVERILEGGEVAFRIRKEKYGIS